MNRIRTGALVAAAVLTAAAGASTVITTGPASAGTSSSPSTFSLRIYPGSEKNLDLGRSGFSAGDQDLFTGTLVRSGKHVGHMVGSCTTVRVGAASADQLCEWSLRLADGQITAAGSVISGEHGPGSFAVPILGGTGHYATAAGQLKITASDGAIPVTVQLR